MRGDSTRERLSDLVAKADKLCSEIGCHRCEYKYLGGSCRTYLKVNYLIANGVTVGNASGKEGCTKCLFAGRPLYKSPCSECGDYNKFEEESEADDQ